MTQKIEVDFGLCESNGVCMGIIPEVFDLDDEDYLHVLQDEVTPENERRSKKPCGSARGKRSSSATSDHVKARLRSVLRGVLQQPLGDLSAPAGRAPVYYNEEYDFYALSRHEDVAAAFKDFRDLLVGLRPRSRDGEVG